jgi:hypothetical protein
MGKGAEGAEADDVDEDGDEDAWVECVILFLLLLMSADAIVKRRGCVDGGGWGYTS